MSYPFNSPRAKIPNRFIKGWTSPLIPDNDSCPFFMDLEESQRSPSSPDLIPVTDSLLRERIYTESMSDRGPQSIQDWLHAEENKNGIDSNSPPAVATEKKIFKKGSPSTKVVAQVVQGMSINRPVICKDSRGGTGALFEVHSPHENMLYSPITLPREQVFEKQPVLKELPGALFVPDSWLMLYHNRPNQDDNQETRFRWLLQALSHLPGEPLEESQVVSLANHNVPVEENLPVVFDNSSEKHYIPLHPVDESMQEPSVVPENTPVVLANKSITLQSATSALTSPLSMPSAIQTHGRRTTRSMTLSRSILKKPGTGLSVGSSSVRGRLAVRFEQPAQTAVKLPAKRYHSPTTWPGVDPMSSLDNLATDDQITNAWDQSHPEVGTGKENPGKTWGPYQTPESVSTNSSTGNAGNLSSGSKTTVIMTGKENHLGSTGHKSKETMETSKSLPPRIPFTGKKLDYERSSSERNIMAGLF